MSLENGSTGFVDTRLDTWKLIAQYLGRSSRTVQRWHMCYDLPVHHLGGDASSVYAYKDELDLWLRKRDGWDQEGSSRSELTGSLSPLGERCTALAEINLERRSAAEEEAIQLVLGAQKLWESLSSSNLSSIVLMYRRAADLSPMSAAAFAGLSQALIAQVILGNLHPAGAFQAAEAALLRALEIDPELFEALCASAMMKIFVERDWEGARGLLDEALRMRPKASQALVGWAFLGIGQGRLDEASDALRRAVMARPLNTAVAELLCWVEYLSGRFGQALALVADARESGNSGAILDTVDALCTVAMSEPENHIQRLEIAAAKSPRNYSLLGVLGFAYGKAGRTSEARMLINSMSHAGLTGVHEFAYPIALTYVGIGEQDEARRWLAQSFRYGSLWSLGFGADPMLAELREDARRQGFFGQLNCPFGGAKAKEGRLASSRGAD